MPRSGLVGDHDARAGELVGVRPGARGVLEAGAVGLAGVLHRGEDALLVRADERAAGLGADRDGEELLDLAPVRTRDGDPEEPVVGAELVAVRGDPQVADLVERHVVGAADWADLAL